VPSESTSYTAVTDGSGRVELKGLRVGEFNLEVTSTDAWQYSRGHVTKADAMVQVDAIVRPEAPAAGGVAWAWVPPGGRSADGKSLVFSLEFVDVPSEAYGGFKHLEGPQSAYIEPCTPDAANDGGGHQANCILGADDFDAAYSPVGNGPMLVQVEDVSLFTGRSYAAALLVDQSDHVISNDPSDRRLFAAKYWMTFAHPGQQSLLGGFAADRPAGGTSSLLPNKPLTLFPLDGQLFASDGRGYFATIDALATLEGGAPAFLAAVDRALDVVADYAPTVEQRAVVVVGDGRDETCGSAAACRTLRDAVIRKSQATGVAIVTVGVAGSAGLADHATLGLLARATPGGAAFWVDDPRQLAPTMPVISQYLNGLNTLNRLTFRVESPVEGAFASGRVVLGQVKFAWVCPMGCSYATLPFAVRIP
jgi:hypothetical protein